MSRRWIAVWLVNWPIQRWHAQQSQAAGKNDPQNTSQAARPSGAPVVLWRADARRGRLVVTACATCQALGIKSHQPLYEATDLIAKAYGGFTDPSRCPVAIEPHDPVADREALGRLADRFQSDISPLVGIDADDDQTILVDVTGIGDWFGDEKKMVCRVTSLLAEQRFAARVAITDTPAAAWGISRFCSSGFQNTSGDIPSGSVVMNVPAGDMMRVVGSLPPRAMRLDDLTAHQMDRLGIRTIHDVLQLPRAGLASRLGNGLLRRIDEITGATASTMTMHVPDAEDVAVCELEYPTEDRDIVNHRLTMLVSTIASHLHARRRGALRMSCRFEMTQHPPDAIDIGLFVPTSDPQHLTRLVLTAMERKHLPGMIQKIMVVVTLAGPLQQYQPTMFGDDSISQVAMRRSLARMIETLAGRLGRDSVVGVQLTQNPLPESAFRPKPLAGESSSTLSLGQSANAKKPAFKSPRQSDLPPDVGPQAGDPMRRPLRMFTNPEPIEVLQLSPDNVPDRIRVANRIYAITRHWGPERIETGWWDGPQVRRDYFRVEMECGSRWWIFRELGNQIPPAWRLHGQFS